jgi:hypothetical protein
MPAITTHYSFALEMGKLFPSAYPEARYLGAQGPDPFFFYGQFPWKKRKNKKEIDAYGSLLHHIDIATRSTPLSSKFMRRREKDKELLFAYIEGLFLHYVLDRDCHPYIFPKAGFSALPEEKAFYSRLALRIRNLSRFDPGPEKGTFTYDAASVFDPPERAAPFDLQDVVRSEQNDFEGSFAPRRQLLPCEQGLCATLRFVNRSRMGFKKVLDPSF